MRHLRVMTFNLRGALSWDGWSSWPLRRPLVRELLARHAPAVVGFQEVLWPARRFLDATLPGHERSSGHPTGHRVISATNPVYVARAEVTVRTQGAFWLSETPERRSTAWGARQVRAATWLRLAHAGRELLLVNTHLDHGGATAREGAARLILARLRLLGWPEVPAVVCGDFNAEPGSSVHQAFLAAGFVDGIAPGDPAAFTFHGFQGPRIMPRRRIDWILASPPLRIVQTTIVRDARPPRYPSDHYPVLADVDFG